MSKPKKILDHLAKGTVIKRIKYQFSGLKKWEDLKTGKKKFIFHRISSSTKLKLYPDSYLSYLILKGDFEIREMDFFKKCIRKGDTVIDIGANIGLFSLLASDCTGKSGKVYSFEPTPSTYERLSENIRLNELKNVFPSTFALSDKKGITGLFVSTQGFDAWNSLGEQPAEGEYDKVEVETETLDRFIAENEISGIRLIKMDVEGFEKMVLLGAKTSLLNLDCFWMIEFNDENFKRNGYGGRELAEKLQKEFGMSLFTLAENGKLLPLIIPQTFEYCNIIAVKNTVPLEAFS